VGEISRRLSTKAARPEAPRKQARRRGIVWADRVQDGVHSKRWEKTGGTIGEPAAALSSGLIGAGDVVRIAARGGMGSCVWAVVGRPEPCMYVRGRTWGCRCAVIYHSQTRTATNTFHCHPPCSRHSRIHQRRNKESATNSPACGLLCPVALGDHRRPPEDAE